MSEYQWNQDDYQVYSQPKKEEKKAKPWLKTAAVAVAASVLTSAVLCSGFFLYLRNNPMPSSYSSTLPPITGTSTTAEGSTINQIATNVGPAVVGIISEVQYTGFFSQSSIQQGSGSGIILRPDGYIVTNHHVIEGASRVTVILSTGEEYEATLVGSDESTDLAVIKIDATDLPYAELGDSDTLLVGDLVVAIGNPLGQELAGSVTVGYVSALNRTISVDENKTLSLLQTDAAINPGNSGGALVNAHGRVVGINTAKISSSNVEGLGFAIPTSTARPIIEDLIEHGRVTGRPLIGISGQELSASISRQWGFPTNEGVYITSVSDGSAADQAGLRRGDIIVEVDGQKVATVAQINAIRNTKRAGDNLKVTFYRDDRLDSVDLTLGAQED